MVPMNASAPVLRAVSPVCEIDTLPILTRLMVPSSVAYHAAVRSLFGPKSHIALPLVSSPFELREYEIALPAGANWAEPSKPLFPVKRVRLPVCTLTTSITPPSELPINGVGKCVNAMSLLSGDHERSDVAPGSTVPKLHEPLVNRFALPPLDEITQRCDGIAAAVCR